MKNLIIFLIILLISVISFGKCNFFQISNDCNDQNTMIVAKNDTISLVIHANWNQGNISYKFQSGSEKLNLNVYTNEPTKLYTEITYKNKSTRIYYDLNFHQMNTEDLSSLQNLWQSINPTFLANIEFLLNELPNGTQNLNLLENLALALMNRNNSSLHPNASIWDYAAYAICYASRVAGGESSAEAHEYCHNKYIAKVES